MRTCWSIGSGQTGCGTALQFRFGKQLPGCAGPTCFPFHRPRAVVQSFIELNGLTFVSIGEREFDRASQAYAEFGKGRHPAALTMGDCFAYACAKTNRAALLCKSDDFGQTDLQVAR